MGKHLANIVVMLAIVVIAVVNMNDPGTVTDTEKSSIVGAIENLGAAADSFSAETPAAGQSVMDGDAVVSVTGETQAPPDNTGALAAIIGAILSLFYSIVSIVKRRRSKGGAATLVFMALPLLILLCFPGCGTTGSVALKLSPDLCVSVEVRWASAGLMTEDLCLDPVDDTAAVRDDAALFAAVSEKLRSLAVRRSDAIVGLPVIREIVRKDGR